MAQHRDTLILNADMQPLSLLPLKTTAWHNAIGGVFKGVYTVVHDYDDWEVHSPSMTMKVPSVVMLNTYVRPRHVASWSKANLWLRDRYTCQYCLQVFAPSELTRDHVVPVCQGGPTTWTNIASSCHPCNNRRGHNTKIQPVRKPYKPSYYELVDLRKQYPIIVPHESWMFYLMWPDNQVILRS